MFKATMLGFKFVFHASQVKYTFDVVIGILCCQTLEDSNWHDTVETVSL